MAHCRASSKLPDWNDVLEWAKAPQLVPNDKEIGKELDSGVLFEYALIDFSQNRSFFEFISLRVCALKSLDTRLIFNFFRLTPSPVVFRINVAARVCAVQSFETALSMIVEDIGNPLAALVCGQRVSGSRG